MSRAYIFCYIMCNDKYSLYMKGLYIYCNLKLGFNWFFFYKMMISFKCFCDSSQLWCFRGVHRSQRQCELPGFGTQVWTCTCHWWWRQESQPLGYWQNKLHHGQYWLCKTRLLNFIISKFTVVKNCNVIFLNVLFYQM